MRFYAKLFHHACFAGEGDIGAGGGGTPGDGGEPKPGDGDQKKKGNDTDPTKPISRELLTAALDTQRRTNEAAIRKATGPLSEKIEALTTSIEEKISQLVETKSKKKEKGGDSELATLKHELEESKRQIDALRAKGEEAEAEKAAYVFQNTVQDALSKAGCTKPEAAFLVVKQHLKTNPDTGKIVHMHHDETFGDLEYDLDKFILEVASETIIPELFRAQSSGAGSAATGDKGGSKVFKFTKEQIKDPAYYKEHRDEIEKAMAVGQVKGIPATG